MTFPQHRSFPSPLQNQSAHSPENFTPVNRPALSFQHNTLPQNFSITRRRSHKFHFRCLESPSSPRILTGITASLHGDTSAIATKERFVIDLLQSFLRSFILDPEWFFIQKSLPRVTEEFLPFRFFFFFSIRPYAYHASGSTADLSNSWPERN